MAKRYYGDFRSIDNSIDPKGQRYRVVIFTGYDGTNPYEYRTLTRPTTHGYDIYIGRVPVNNYALTMTDHPFVVNYEGNAENIYKPYRCSTATVSFLQNNINLDFLNSNGKSTLVVLLKWKTEVSEVNGRMYNAETGETLNKHVVRENGEIPITWYNDYDPDRYDNFCFTVEWVGYATPETFSMEYDHVNDAFTLNAQDALSTLQYSKYSWIGDTETDPVVTFNSILLDFCQSLGTYRKIYVTDTVKLPDVFADIMTKIYEQQANNFDEDKKPTDKLTVLEQILTYLNLTAIPYKNNLIITTPNAIAEGLSYYFTYTLPNNGYIVNFPATDGDTYTAQPCEELSNLYAVSQNSYADGDTTISTNNVYNSVTAECDEYEVDMLLPDINDTKNLKDAEYTLSTWTEETQPSPAVNYYWEHESFNSNTPDLVLLQRDYHISGSHETNWAAFDEVDLHRPNLQYYPTVYVCDDGGLHVGTYTDCMQQPYNPTRKYVFLQGFRGNSSVSGADNDTFRTMMIARTKMVVMSAEQYLFIKGRWQFHLRSTVPSSYGVYASGQYANSAYCYVRAKVSCCGKWLDNDGTDNYGWAKYKWVDAEPERGCKLYTEYEADKHAMDTDFNFRKNTRNFDGIVVPLPVDANNVKVGKIQIEFGRPVGCGATVAWSATLRDFQFEIHSKAYYESRGTDSTADHNNNTEFKTEIDTTAIEDFEDIKLNLSSDKDKGIRYSQTIRNGYKIMPKIYNVATCNYHLPEQHITSNIANQYATPTINLQMTLHNELTPYSLVTWSKMDGRKFIVNSTQIDYECNTQNVTISEVKAVTPRTTVRRDMTRNYRRNHDLVFNDNIVADANEITLTNETVGSATFAASNGYMTATSDDVEIGCITIQPNFNDCAMQISVPNDLEDTLTVEVDDRQLIITY